MIKRSNTILNSDKYRSDILAIVFLILAAIVLFLPVIMKWQGIFHNDQAMSEFLEHYFFAHNLQKGIIPLWNPHTWCGAKPWCSFIYAGVDYYLPLWPFHFFANLNNLDGTYWIISILPLFLHYVLAAVGMFVLLRKAVKCKAIAAFIGAFAYIYSSAFTYAYVSEHNLIMQAWLPWLIYVYIKTVEKWRLWKLFLGGIIFAFIWIAGKPQYMPFIMIIWGSVVFLLTVEVLHMEGTKSFIKPFLAAFIIFVLGTALSAVYLYPIIDGTRYTQLYMKLSANEAMSYTPANLSFPYLVTLFLPNFFGNIMGNNFIFKRLMFWDANMSGGMAVTLLVFLGAFIPIIMFSANLHNERRRRYAILGIFLYIFSILCASGGNTPFYRLFIGWIPIVGGLPFPIRYRMIQCFAVSILVAIGINSLITYKFSVSKRRLYKLVWFYVAFSFCIISIVLFLPGSNDSEKLWLGNTDSEAEESFTPLEIKRSSKDNLFPTTSPVRKSFLNGASLRDESLTGFTSRKPIGVYTPKVARVKKIKLFFTGKSEGEIRYASIHKISPDGGNLIKKYHVEKEGWVTFSVNVPPNKFLWVYPESGDGNIGYWKEKNVQEKNPCFVYDYSNNWVIRSSINAIALYQSFPKRKSSLFFKLKNGYVIKTPIVTSLLYWLLASLIIIVGMYGLSMARFGYLLGGFALIEFFVFGMMAFYGCTFNEAVTQARTFLPHNVRALRPSDHPMLQTMVRQVPAVATDSTLRIASDYPFYDNFVYLNNRYALMGESTFPLEKRFKYAIETAYGQTMGPALFYEGRGCFPESVYFLSNFSVGYFLSNNRKRVFRGEKCISLMNSSNSFVHINPDVLPRVYTMDRVITVSERKQMKELVWDDLRRAVYINYDDAAELIKDGATIEDARVDINHENTMNIGKEISGNYISRFKILQARNCIKQINFNNPNQIGVDVDITIPSMLVFTEVWYPGWEAAVDGKQAKIYRVNYCQRGIWLEEGNHSVQLKFNPLAWRIGLGISLGVMGLMVALLALGLIKKW